MTDPTLNPQAKTRLLSTWDVKYGAKRRTIRPRLVILHTNGGGGPASIGGVVNMAENGGTQPHFQAQGGYGRDGDANVYQLLPTDREGVGSWNGDGFAITIETQDPGWPTPGGAAGWSPAQFEAIAQVVAVECQRWGIPVRLADRWDGAGIGYHRQWGLNTRRVSAKGEGLPVGSLPGYVNPWTKTVEKVCPGDARVAQMPALVARVAEILAPTPPPQEDDMPLSDADKAWISLTVLEQVLAVTRSPEYDAQMRRVVSEEVAKAVRFPDYTPKPPGDGGD